MSDTYTWSVVGTTGRSKDEIITIRCVGNVALEGPATALRDVGQGHGLVADLEGM